MTINLRRMIWLTLGILVLGVLVALAQGLAACPPVLAGLMPANAAHVTGQYNSAGTIGLGYAAADLPFDNPCTKE